MGRNERSVARLKSKLHALGQMFPEDFFLPSLRETPSRVHGYAFKFTLTLPLFASDGNRVFLAEHLGQLHHFFDNQFGGCSGASHRSGPPYFGEYRPPGSEAIRDHNTITYVYANPIDACDRLFKELKTILRNAPLIPQDEILIERTEVFLV